MAVPQSTATLNVVYYKKYDGVTNMPSNASSSSSTPIEPGVSHGSVWLGVKIATRIPVREGYRFLGWCPYDNDDNELVQPGSNYTSYVPYGTTRTYSLYSRWAVNTNTITYYSNGGETETFTQTKNVGSSINISSTIPVRTNFIFVGWNTDPMGFGTAYAPGQVYSDDVDLGLYAIWKAAASVPTVNKEYANIGEAITITTNRIDPSAVHTLAYAFEGSTGAIGTNVTTSVSWTIPSNFYNLLSTKPSAICTVYCETYINGVKVGDTQSVSFTVSVPSNIVPTISVNVAAVNEQDVAPIIGSSVVQGYSKVSFTLSSTPGVGAEFAFFTISGPDLPSSIDTTASTVVTNTISGSGTLKWIVYATDTRGRSSNSLEVNVPVLPYSRPSISPISVYRCNANGDHDQSTGTYLNARAFFSASNVGSNAIVSSNVYYRKANGSSVWTQIQDFSPVSGDWTGAIGGGNIEIEYSYELKYEIQDSIGAATNQPVVYIESYPVPSSAGISYGIYNDRLRLGGLVEEPGFVVDWASKFKNPVTIQNQNALGITALIAGEGDNISLLLTGNK